MILGVIKPVGPTSFDVVSKIRKITGIKTVGHAGTLDPLASGILVVAVGRDSTKKINSLMNTDKEYIASIKLGQTSTTDDSEGEKKDCIVATQPTKKQVLECLKLFVGTIEQLPPLFSAIKVKGRPLYDYARKGKTVQLKPRIVTINTIELLEYDWPIMQIKVNTEKGVYIRSLARDIGKALKVGGRIQTLERTSVGTFDYANAIPFEDLSRKLPPLIKKVPTV